jgi:hypothetical protein
LDKAAGTAILFALGSFESGTPYICPLKVAITSAHVVFAWLHEFPLFIDACI